MFVPLLMATAIAFTPLTDNPLAPDSSMNGGVSESCAVPNAPAVVKAAAIPDTPFMAQIEHASGTAYVQVNIDPDGSVVSASIARSSGNPLLDREAISTTQLSQFRPEIKDCQPVGGSYLYEVEFPSE